MIRAKHIRAGGSKLFALAGQIQTTGLLSSQIQTHLQRWGELSSGSISYCGFLNQCSLRDLQGLMSPLLILAPNLYPSRSQMTLCTDHIFDILV